MSASVKPRAFWTWLPYLPHCLLVCSMVILVRVGKPRASPNFIFKCDGEFEIDCYHSFIHLLLVCGRLSRCSSGWLWTHSPSVSASPVLGICQGWVLLTVIQMNSQWLELYAKSCTRSAHQKPQHGWERASKSPISVWGTIISSWLREDRTLVFFRGSQPCSGKGSHAHTYRQH